jgi:transcriptional regulator with XRE-family HTH domain
MARKRMTFSEQIRAVIENSGTTRYALARQVGVSESALSRFASGERGLNLSTLDRLADALGLEISVNVQNVKRPSPKGRKPAKGRQRMRDTKTKEEWQSIATAMAREAHENHFSSRRGIWHLEDLDILCAYNNNPYAKSPKLREEETAEIRKFLAAHDIDVIAYATWGKDGYTYAMLIDASSDREAWIADNMRQIVMRTYERAKGA